LGGHVAKALLILGCLVGLLVAAAPAGADSIVYVKDGNVWLANPDGSGRYQVTSDGTAAQPWRSPSQADDGTIAAGFGNEIVRMRQNGEVLSRIDPTALLDSAGDPVDGPPIGVSISPDGTRIAYTMADYACPVAADCDTRTVTAYTAADHLTPATAGGTTYLRNPSWVTNSRTLQFGGYGHQVDIHDFGAAADVHWFDDADVVGQAAATDLGDGELNRQGTRLALIRGYGDEASVGWFAVQGDALGGLPPTPAPLCFSSADRGIHGPTWSPDGASVAFADPEGIWVKPAADDCESPQPALMIPGGSQPDWGPAAAAPPPRGASHADSGPHGGSTSHGRPGKRARAIRRCRKLKRHRARARCIRKARGHGARRVLTSVARWQPPHFKRMKLVVELTGIHVDRWHVRDPKGARPEGSWVEGSGTQTLGFSTPHPMRFEALVASGETPTGERLPPLSLAPLAAPRPLKGSLRREASWRHHDSEVCDREGGCEDELPVPPVHLPASCPSRRVGVPASLEIGRGSGHNVLSATFETLPIEHPWSNCPPDMDGASRPLALAQPASLGFGGGIARIAHLAPGETVTLKAHRTQGAVDGAPSARCSKLAGPGRQECAATDLTLEVTRLK
jgi:hypothetical protein